MHSIFNEFSLLLMISAVAGAIAIHLRQPVLIAYILVGLAAGPAALGLVAGQDQINLLAQVGITVLLFMVGLKLDLQHVRHIGPVAVATGLGQLFFTIIFGFLIVLVLDRSAIEALYIAVALTFSSTIIVVKLLSDKREIDSLHGRIAVGFLIVQDIAVVLAMMTMSAMRGAGEDELISVALTITWRVAAAVVVMFILMRWVLPRVVAMMGQSRELLLIFAVAYGTSLAALGEASGFSKEAGAFLAGFSLASTAYRDAIDVRLGSLRDFLLLFFFIDLGVKLELSTLGNELGLAAILSLFVLVGNPLIVMAIMGFMGYRKRTGFLAGLTVAQISEFSIIFIAMGISLGHIESDSLGLITMVGLVTIALSTYMILYSHRLYEWLAPWLGIFERRNPYREMEEATIGQAGQLAPDVVVLGLGRYGHRLAHGLHRTGLSVLGVDFDPQIATGSERSAFPAMYGDATDAAFLEGLPLARVKWLVSTLPDLESNRSLVNALHEHKFAGGIAVVAREEQDQDALKMIGVQIVLYPVRDAVDFAAETLAELIKPKETPG